MRRIITLLFVFILVFMFNACESNINENSAPAESSQALSEASEEESKDESIEESAEESIDESKEESAEASDDVSGDDAGFTVEESVIYDENGIKITVKGVSSDDLMGTIDLKLLVENSSGENLTVSAELCSVNGVMVTPLFIAEVAPEKKANETLSIFVEELNRLEIDNIADISFELRIYNTDTYEDIAVTDVITVKTTADGLQQEINSEGKTIYEADGIKIVQQNIGKNDLLDTTDIYFYIENNTDKNISVSYLDASVNGYVITPVMYCALLPGTMAITTLSIFESDLTDNDIEEISEIEFVIDITDYDSWETIFQTEPIIIEPEATA